MCCLLRWRGRVGELDSGMTVRKVDFMHSFATPLLVRLVQLALHCSKSLFSHWQME